MSDNASARVTMLLTGLFCFGSAQATLIGDTIDVTLTGGIAISDVGVLVGPGIEFQGGDASTNFGSFLFPMEFMDVQATSVVMGFDTSLGFNAMLTFSSLDLGSNIIDVILTTANTNIVLAGFTATSFTLDMSAWFFVGDPADIRVDLVTAVPEPNMVGLLAIGLIGLGLAIRRRKI